MAAAASTISAVAAPVAAVVSGSRKLLPQRAAKVNYVSSFGGLKAHNHVVSLGVPVSTEHAFAKIVGALVPSKEKRGGGGALSSTCNAAAEIFTVAAILPGLVLVGVAVGFVLLGLEASLEEEEA
ncbi:hypothetical protein M569_08240 [Genlisea aurea]|uniref:Uncharacterized protein n=1 Tax=Genlisea aurea TaxID=192259 RepID=S8CHT2_9LAMI|nr:hypothetical protein M569_08240 [Genlisea aurea]